MFLLIICANKGYFFSEVFGLKLGKHALLENLTADAIALLNVKKFSNISVYLAKLYVI